MHDVAGHQVSDLDAHRLAVARRCDLVADLGVHRLRGAFCSELVDEPETDRRGDDQPDDDRIEAFAHDSRHRRRSEQEPQQRAAQLASEHRPRARMMGTHRVRPEPLGPFRHLRRIEPRRPRPERIEDLARASCAAVASIGGSDAAASTNDGVSVTPKYGGCGHRRRRSAELRPSPPWTGRGVMSHAGRVVSRYRRTIAGAPSC